MNDGSRLYPAVEYDDIRQLMEAALLEHADRTAFILKRKTAAGIEYESISYERFGSDIRALATALIQRGYAGKRIAMIGKNSYPWIAGFFAGLLGGLIVVPLDRGLPQEEIVSCLRRSRTDILLYDAEHGEQIESIRQHDDLNVDLYIPMERCGEDPAFPDLVEEGTLLRSQQSEACEAYDRLHIDPDIMSLILFTSGTTSASKAVMLSQRNIASNIYALTQCEAIYPTDVNLAFLPFHHTFSSTGITFILTRGATNVFCDGLKYIAQNLKEYKVSVFICVPLILEAMHKKIFLEAKKQGKDALLRRMLKVSSALNRAGIDIRRKLFRSVIDQLGGHLRFAISGAAAISPEVAKGFNDLGILTVQGYGLTETSPVLTAENAKNIRTGSVGIPMSNVEIEIRDPDEHGVGEVVARGPNVMLGYYEDPVETDKVLKDGWFYTGDLGYIDRDGFLFLSGRKKNVIVQKSGKNVFPEEIELLLNRLDYLNESMVFGWEKGDDLVVSAKLVYDEATVLDLLPQYKGSGGLDVERFRAHVQKDIDDINASLPVHKQIRRLILGDEPTVKTTTAKIKRHEEIKKIGAFRE